MRTYDEMKSLREGWEDCLSVARNFSDHYSFSEEQQEVLFGYAKLLGAGSVAMEVGVCNGKTSAVLAYCSKTYGGFEAHGVDAFILENTPEAFNQRMAEHELPFKLHYALTSPAPVGTLELQPIQWTTPLDLLIIDGSHTDPWVSADMAFWLPLLKPGAPVFFHDYDGREDSASCHVDTRRAVERHTSDWAVEYFVHGLMVKRKPILVEEVT